MGLQIFDKCCYFLGAYCSLLKYVAFRLSQDDRQFSLRDVVTSTIFSRLYTVYRDLHLFQNKPKQITFTDSHVE